MRRPWFEALLFSLIMLTQLDGNPIWVESTAVVIIKPSEEKGHQCGKPARATISIAGRGLCVRETPDEIRAKIKEAH